ncbi:MAG: hypothetical protein Q9208_007290 [Pyrenodesmia sp. 3 TL-2023]
MAGTGQVLPLGQGATRNRYGDPTATICKSLLVPLPKMLDDPDELENFGKAYGHNDRELRSLQGQVESGTKSASGGRDVGHGDGNDQENPAESNKDLAGESLPQRSSSKLRRSADQQNKKYEAKQNKIQQPLTELATSRKPRLKLKKFMYAGTRANKCIQLEPAPRLFEWGPNSAAQVLLTLPFLYRHVRHTARNVAAGEFGRRRGDLQGRTFQATLTTAVRWSRIIPL